MDAFLAIDRALFGLLNGSGPKWLDAFFVFITEDEPLRIPLLLLWLALIFLCGPRWRRRALWLIPLVALSDSLSSHVLKELFCRPRPCHEELEGLRLLVDCGPGYSFPSSHAANMGAAGFFLAAGARRWSSTLLILALPVLVAYSRVHVGVHYPADIVGGFLFGGLLALGVAGLMRAVPWRWMGFKDGSRGASRSGWIHGPNQ